MPLMILVQGEGGVWDEIGDYNPLKTGFWLTRKLSIPASRASGGTFNTAMLLQDVWTEFGRMMTVFSQQAGPR